jgi:cytochrome P450
MPTAASEPIDIFELEAPEGNTIAGHLLDLGRDPLRFLTHCAHNYGEIIPLRLGLTATCLLVNPDHIEQVLKERDAFIKSRGFRVLKTLLGSGLLTNEGESWFCQRRLAQPVFQQKRIAGYGKIMVDYTEQILSGWESGKVLDIHAEMMGLTLNIVMKCIFDQDVSEGEAKDVAHALDVTMDWFESKRKQNFLVWEWFPRPENIRYRNAIAKMDESIYNLIAQKRQNPGEGTDLLSMLMEAKDEDDGSSMDDKQLRDEVATLMLAGHETTANALSWTWMLLAQNPQCDRKLTEELQYVLNGRSPTVADLPKLRYTEQIVKESLRLYPPVSIFGREAVADYTLDNYCIPAGCVVTISQWVMHRHPAYFDCPEDFIPERWENNLEKSLPRGVYIPFGDGPRICIGKGFAMMEAVLMLATIAQKYRLSLVEDYPIVPQPSITLRPEEGIQVQLHQRPD